MIKFDFSTYMKKYIDADSIKVNTEELFKKLENDSMNGWYKKCVDDNTLSKIETVAKRIQDNSDVLLVIAIGGSFMGSYALKELFVPKFKKLNTEVIYIGNNLSNEYLEEVIDYIKDKSVSVNVISKSGNTLEINLTYKKVKEYLEKRYDSEELKERIIITTDISGGILRREVNDYGYTSFEIPKNIGGRYSIMTSAHLLPLRVLNLDIDELISGYMNGFNYKEEAYKYSFIRNKLFSKNKFIENFSVYQPSLYYFTEWLKQLFGESEGKDNKGIFPISTVNTRDLHSLGQFLQEGKDIIFETVIRNLDDNDINNTVLESVCRAHYKGYTPSNVISISKINLYNIGEVMAFFMTSAALSAYLFDVDPFNQPGVEKYKDEVKTKIDITNL